MPSTSFLRLLFAAALWLMVCAPLAAAEPSGSPEMTPARLSTSHRLSFFEKTALKIAAWRLRKAMAKQDWAGMRGDTAAPCGQILLLSGQIIDAELTDITPTEVKYRPCGQPDYPKFVLSKQEVKRVVGPDWVKLYENPEKAAPNAEQTGAAVVNHPGAIAAASFGIATFASIFFFNLFGIALLFALVSAVLGIVSWKAIRKHPHKYKGKEFAIVGLLMGGLILVLGLLALSSVGD